MYVRFVLHKLPLILTRDEGKRIINFPLMEQSFNSIVLEKPVFLETTCA